MIFLLLVVLSIKKIRWKYRGLLLAGLSALYISSIFYLADSMKDVFK